MENITRTEAQLLMVQMQAEQHHALQEMLKQQHLDLKATLRHEIETTFSATLGVNVRDQESINTMRALVVDAFKIYAAARDTQKTIRAALVRRATDAATFCLVLGIYHMAMIYGG